MKIKQVNEMPNDVVLPIEPADKKIKGYISEDKRVHWGDIIDDITKQKDLINYIDNHSADISGEVKERKAADAKLDARITELEESIPEQLEEVKQEVYDNVIPRLEDVEDAVKIKASAMYYDELCDFGEKKLWYMTDINEILDPETMKKEEILSHLIKDNDGNPLGYELGKGGGGGREDTEVKVLPISWPTTIAYGTKCELKVNWHSLKDQVPTGPCKEATVSIDRNVILIKSSLPQGNVTFDITEEMAKLPVGSHNVEVKFTDVYSNSARTIGSISTISISLTSNFNADRVLSGSFNYTYIPTGTIDKTVHFIRDGVQIATDIVKTSGEQQTHKFSGWTHGSHTFKVYFTCMIDGNEVKSNELYYDLMYEVKGNKTPIITSTFLQDKEEQDISFTIPYKVYSPGYNKSNIELLVNDVVTKTLSVDQSLQNWENRFSEVGDYKLQIKCGATIKTFNVTIYESEIDVKPVTEDLALALNTISRSNAEPHPEIWEDKDRGISCNLTGFNFSSDGWLQDTQGNTILRVTGSARVDIPYKPFAEDFKNSGKTIELEIATSEVMNYETTIMSCFSGNRGFYLTPQLAKIKSQQSELQTQYKEDEHVRITFVIEKKNETHIIFMYINGVMCGAHQYPETDEFRQLDPVNISIGSDDATIDIYNIRVYDNNLNRKQVVTNWIADTQVKSLKKYRYNHNNNYNEIGEIVIEKLPNDLPHIIWDIDPLPQYKGDKRPGNAEYVDPQDDTRNFTSQDATYNVQGTSSAVYPTKNIRIKYKKNKDWPTTNFNWLDKDGNTITKYTITPDGIGDNYFTYKVDYASSEGANNVELTKLYNDASKAQGILTPPQKQDDRVKVGIDGYPIIAFSKDGSGKVSFCTKANFNNDKANEAVYGFAEGDESWEITNNSAAEGNFKKGVTPETFANAFEIRFPDEDGYSDLSKLGPMTNWVASTDPEQATGAEITPIQYTYETVKRSEDGTYSRVTVTSPLFTNDTAEYRLTKFKAELKNWFNVDSTVFYYIYTLLFLMIDSRAKNAFPTYFAERVAGDGGNRWFWLPYDMDTAIGINNEGKLVFDYNLEDTDKVGGANVFNGQDSVMWNNIRKMFDGEIGQMYSNLRTTGGLLSYEETETRFENHQSKWSESIFNEDSFEKYVKVLRDKGDNYLEMLQGSKAEQRKWWLYNRFKYIDSKYLAGESRSDVLQFRAYVPAGTPKPSITLTPYADIYATVSYSNGAAGTKSARATRGQAITIPNPFGLEDDETDQETYIYSASQLKYVGDLSPFKPDTVKAANAIRLQELKVGNNAAGYTNPNLRELTLGRNTLLKKLDVRNCINLATAIDVKNCGNLEEIYFDNTKITSLLLPNAGILKKLHLPETVTNLTIKNQPLLEELQLAGTSNVDTLWLENIPMELVDVEELINQMPTGAAVRLVGFEKEVDIVDEIKVLYDKLDTMSGIDAHGEHTEKAQVNGKIYIDSISWEDWSSLMDRYPDIEIISPTILCTIKFFNETTEFNTQIINRGQSAINPGIPHKNSSAQFYYYFKQWDKSYENVQSSLNINAIFDEHTQTYTFKFDPQTTLVDPIPDKQVLYGNLLTKPTDPHIEGAVFNGWFKEPETINMFDFNIPVTGPFNPDPNDKPLPITLYGKWTDENIPVVEISVQKFNKFRYRITDNIAVVAYAITKTNVEPTEWTSVTPSPEVTGEYIINSKGSYYVWGKDASNHIGMLQVTAYELSKDPSVGTSITLSQNEEIVGVYTLQGSEIKVHVDLDSHYENLVIKFNGVEIENDSLKLITENALVTTQCSPKSYTVHFNMMGHGSPIEDQTIIYGHLVNEPQNQYDPETNLFTDGWYKEQELINLWNFSTDTVQGDTELFVKWSPNIPPSTIIVTIKEESVPQTIKCNVNQTNANGVEINWDDGSSKSTSTSTGNITFEHTYTESGTYGINIKCKEGTHLLGWTNVVEKNVIEPINTVQRVTFAYNMAYTGNGAFKGAIDLEELTLSNYMTKVARNTFEGCTKLRTVEIPRNITILEAKSFYRCSSLQNVVLHNYITDIEESSFSETGLVEFNIPTSLTKLNSSVLAVCTNLTQIIVPENIEEIGSSVFAACSNLEHITLMNKNLKVSEYAFNNCPKLLTVGPLGGDYNIRYAWEDEIPNNAFSCGYTQSYFLSINFPITIKKIGNNAFKNWARLNSIELPVNLQRIGSNVFERCSGLKVITIPKSCISIGQNAFIYCTGLLNVYIYASSSEFKADVVSASWFLYAGGALLHIPKFIDTPETAKMAYGMCWNFADTIRELRYTNDLDV